MKQQHVSISWGRLCKFAPNMSCVILNNSTFWQTLFKSLVNVLPSQTSYYIGHGFFFILLGRRLGVAHLAKIRKIEVLSICISFKNRISVCASVLVCVCVCVCVCVRVCMCVCVYFRYLKFNALVSQLWYKRKFHQRERERERERERKITTP